MATVLVNVTTLGMRAALWLSCALFSACRPAGDGSASSAVGSTPTINVQGPAPTPTAEAGDILVPLSDGGSLVPIVGYVFERHPDYDLILGRKVSEDGSLVAIWENLYAGKEQNADRYLIVKRVDGDKEVARFLINESGDNCGFPSAAPVCNERQARADEFLSRHKWTKLSLFQMEPGVQDHACHHTPQRQRLTFENAEITFGDLRVVVAKPTGDILVDRKLPGWRVFASKPIPPPDAFFVHFIGLSLERRVLLIALRYCGSIGNADVDTHYYAIRLPEIN